MASIKFANIKKRSEDEGKKGVKIYPFKTEKYLEVCRFSSRLSEKDLSLHTKRGIYWGNMKLFVFLLEFIERYVDLEKFISTKNDTESNFSLKKNNVYCCYVGAAPGVSIALVAEMYPEIQFYLYDPYGGEERKPHERFDEKLRELSNVHLFERYFTDEDADTWKEVRLSTSTPRGLEMGEDEINSVYFISDIRSREIISSEEGVSAEALLQRENEILEDMNMQRRWVEKINPNRASLKFRPRHFSVTGERKFRYLDGVIYTQCFEKEDSYESRLVVRDNITTLDYDILAYEEALNYHNAVFRGEMLFFNPLNGGRNPIAPMIGLGRDYDSCRFALSIRGYLYSREEDFTEEDVIKVCDFVIKYLSSRNYGGKGQKDLSERRSKHSSRRK